MKTIAQMFQKQVPKTPNNFGLEFEMEGIDNYVPMPEGWDNEKDGSLRDNGREFVSNPPIPYDEVLERCERLKETLDECNIKPRLSNLASTHIHMDVRDMDWKQCKDLIALIMMFEKSIAKASGADRYNNYFALGNSEADVNLLELQMVDSEEDFIVFVARFRAQDARYSGINYDAIAKYGSLELRFLGMMVNPVDVMPWVHFYHNLKMVAMEDDTDFNKLYESISINKLETIINIFNPPFALDVDDMIDGVRCAQDLTSRCHYQLYSLPNEGNGIHNFYKNN